MSRFLHFLVSAALICSMTAGLSGCGSKDESSNEILTEADMPYGSTMARLSVNEEKGVPITVEYDHRFLTEDEAVIVSNYFAALNNADDVEMNKLYYPGLFTYLVNKASYSDGKLFLTDTKETLESNLSAKIDMNYLIIQDIQDNDSIADKFASAEADLAEAVGVEVLENINSKKSVGIEVLYDTDDAKDLSLTRQTGDHFYLYIYEIEGKYYVL